MSLTESRSWAQDELGIDGDRKIFLKPLHMVAAQETSCSCSCQASLNLRLPGWPS